MIYNWIFELYDVFFRDRFYFSRYIRVGMLGVCIVRGFFDYFVSDIIGGLVGSLGCGFIRVDEVFYF